MASVNDIDNIEASVKEIDVINANVSNAIQRVYPELEDLTVTPSIEEQNFKSEKYGFNNVTVEAIEGEELNITPSTAEQNYEGLYDKVNVSSIEIEEINVEPSIETQIILPTEGKFINKVNIALVTADIDPDIIAENIKVGKNILGIDGTFTKDATATANDICRDKIAYVNGTKITGTLNEIKSGQNYNGTTYSSITDDPNYNRSRLKTKINSNMILQDPLLRAGSYIWTNMPYSSLCAVFNITADVLKAGFTLWGVTGTLDTSDITNSEDYATCLALSQSILGGDA